MTREKRPTGKLRSQRRGSSEWEETTDVDPPWRAGALKHEEDPIEVQLVEEPLGLEPESRWIAAEVWTTHRVYRMDADMICMEVINRETGEIESRHPFLGARLSGGERCNPSVVAIAFPLPVPGTEAVFRRGEPGRNGRFGTTSTVERVVLRVRLKAVTMRDQEAIWEELTTGIFQRRAGGAGGAGDAGSA